MARLKRSDTPYQPVPPPVARPVIPASPWGPTTADEERRLGGPVGSMQADLARRLGQGAAGMPGAVSPEEKVVRFLSVAGGYGALAAAYAVVAFLILR